MILLPNACWLGNVWSIGERYPLRGRNPAHRAGRNPRRRRERNPTFGRTGAQGCDAAADEVCGPAARCECGSILGRLNLAERRNSLCAAEILSTAGGNSLAEGEILSIFAENR